MTNLLLQPLIQAEPHGFVTLPGLFALLARDGVESYPALRAHQEPAWHMFLVQLAALALFKASRVDLPETEAEWLALLRALTPDFPGDEPWRLAVADRAKPAFLQPPVPEGVNLPNPVPTADALDLLITSRNHDVKQAVAADGAPQDWIFSLVSLQTGEGYGGAGNHGIARMNGGSSSRPMLALAPLPQAAARLLSPRTGLWFCRDVRVLLAMREKSMERHGHIGYRPQGGIGLVWTADWPEGEQLAMKDLDIWFIEACRRVRLVETRGRLSGWKGTSKTARIDAKHLKGDLGDPWAPIHVAEGKSLTLSGGDFDYRRLIDLLFSGNWNLPCLAQPSTLEKEGETMALVAAALSRGNSKTEGFKSRVLPLGGKPFLALVRASERQKELYKMAEDQAADVAKFDRTLRNALALAAAGGERDQVGKPHYAHARDAQDRFERAADALFFPHLFARFEAEGPAREAARLAFLKALTALAVPVFDGSLPAIPVSSIRRQQAHARARRQFHGALRSQFPDVFAAADAQRSREEMNDAVA